MNFATLKMFTLTAYRFIFRVFFMDIFRLVADVFGKGEDNKMRMEKVTMLIWQFRDDPRVVQFVAQFLTKVRIF